MTKLVKVGQMPGRITEFAVEETQTFAEVIALAELDTTGYEVKADGTKVQDLNAPIGGTNLILLAKMIKGNVDRLVKVGIMPGRITEYSVDSTSSIQDLLTLAELDTAGYEVKVDGTRVTDFSQPVGQANLVLLAKQIKGNK